MTMHMILWSASVMSRALLMTGVRVNKVTWEGESGDRVPLTSLDECEYAEGGREMIRLAYGPSPWAEVDLDEMEDASAAS